MNVVATIAALRHALDDERRLGKRVGFVATMGALHEGHLSLVERAKHENDIVVMSIFVNPLQFGPNEDLAQYPRPFEADKTKAQTAGVDYLFHPGVDEMYPDGSVQTRITVSELGEQWEGAARPGHFDGMATVVAKLFNIVGPGTAYFGEKDWQQLCIVRQIVHDLSVPVTVVGCPTVREPDGLARSSRNVYLSDAERAAAAAIPRAIDAAQRATASPVEAATRVLNAEPLIQLDYVAVVNEHLRQTDTVGQQSRLLIAVTVGTTHLIDNAGFPEHSSI